MKNFEKYEKDIKDIGYDFAMEKEGTKISRCGFIICSNCKFKGNCFEERFKWLYEDYKEPLLTDEERAYLKEVIKPIRENFKYLKRRTLNNIQIEFINNEEIFLYLSSMPLRNLKIDKPYSLEELGL